MSATKPPDEMQNGLKKSQECKRYKSEAMHNSNAKISKVARRSYASTGNVSDHRTKFPNRQPVAPAPAGFCTPSRRARLGALSRLRCGAAPPRPPRPWTRRTGPTPATLLLPQPTSIDGKNIGAKSIVHIVLPTPSMRHTFFFPPHSRLCFSKLFSVAKC